MGNSSQLTDLEKARLFLRALNSYTMAEAALRHREKLKPPFRSLVDRLVSNWERTQTQARSVSTDEAEVILREFMEALDRRMVRGQRDIMEHFRDSQKTGPLFLAWGLFYLFKTRALDLAEELTPPATVPAAVEKSGEESPPAAKTAADMAALREFQMALGLGS